LVSNHLARGILLLATFLIEDVSSSAPIVGLGLVERLLSQYASSDIAIFGLTRNPAKADALVALQAKYPNKLVVVAYDGVNTESVKRASKEVESRIGWVDVVIGSAGQL
jgi:NAD(P)-dependent dehydrogenase (short-subunit alcohol dehydrogenase family)